MMIFGFVLWMILLVVGLIALRGFRVTPPTFSRPDTSPEEILKVRYARGEITREAFEQMRRDLRQA